MTVIVNSGRSKRVGASKPSTVIGSWELIRCLHRGAYSDVHLARPLGAIQSCADYVVKVLRQEMHSDVVARELLSNEAAAGRANQSPHLAPILEAHIRSEPCYLVLPRLEGVTLDVLCRERQCDPRRALRITRQIAEGLAEMHDGGWRHGDVKPANIIISPEGHATLIDFSMASRANAPLRGIGTPRYAAPETERGVSSAASDIYALGAVLFEMLAGRVLFDGATTDELTRAHREFAVPAVTEFQPLLPSCVDRVVRRMLQKDSQDRPFATDVVEMLTPIEIELF